MRAPKGMAGKKEKKNEIKKYEKESLLYDGLQKKGERNERMNNQ